MRDLRYFRYWCFKVLPLVYDDSLSYYEVLCKVVHYINQMIENQKEFANDLNELRQDLKVVQDWIANFNTTIFEKWMQQWLMTAIFVGISDAGYIVYYIPGTWDTITFNTTGLDIQLDIQPEYGHLVLSY